MVAVKTTRVNGCLLSLSCNRWSIHCGSRCVAVGAGKRIVGPQTTCGTPKW